MRVAIVAHSASPWTASPWASHYARELAARGHRVRVLSFHPAPIEGVDCVFVGREPFRPAHKLAYLEGVPRVRRELRAFQPDVVYAPYLSSNGLVTALAWAGPWIVSARGGDVLRQAGRLPVPRPLLGPLVRFVCRRADLVHVVSEELRDAVIGLGVPDARVVCFPVGVDTELFRPRADPASPPGSHVVCTRRQEPIYENHVLVEALARLRDRGVEFVCTLVGGGPLLAERRAQVEAQGLADSVSFLGQVPHAALPGVLAQADVYVSAASSDGTSSSLLEALAAGCFPVVARIPANAGWIRDGETGASFAAGDSEELAQRLEWALRDPELRRRAAVENRAEVRRRGDMRANMDRLAELLERVVASRAGVSVRAASVSAASPGGPGPGR
jgi:glycosyltransferase involved in cell wall biosynthesis